MKTEEEILALIREYEWQRENVAASGDDIALAKKYLDEIASLNDGAKEVIGPVFSPTSTFYGDGELMSDEENALLERLLESSTNAYVAAFLTHAYQWSKLCQLKHPATFGKEALFEPLLTLIERHVNLGIRKGFFVVGDDLLPLINWPAGYGKCDQ